jgi:hypothetical protein
LTHRAVTAALLWAGFPSAALKQTSVSNIKYILATCVADDGFVSHGTMLGESYQTSSAVRGISVAISRCTGALSDCGTFQEFCPTDANCPDTGRHALEPMAGPGAALCAEAAPAASAGANTGHPKRTPRVRLGNVPADSDTYESVTCILCQRVHLVNPRTGRVLGENDE